MTLFRKPMGSATAGICVLLLIWMGSLNANAGETPSARTTAGIPLVAAPQAWSELRAAYLSSLESASPGRFQAVRLDGSSIFILDTRLGYMWAWAFGEQGGFTTYQGRVVPGLKMGDVIEAYEKRRVQGKK